MDSPNSKARLAPSDPKHLTTGQRTPGSGSDRLWREDVAHFVHPFTHFDSFKEGGSLIVTEGKGASVFDANGKRYLDGIGGLWCMSIGFGDEEMVAAITDQARRLHFYSAFVNMTNPPAVELATRLAQLAPGDLNCVFYTTGGSEANDTAVRLIPAPQGSRTSRSWNGATSAGTSASRLRDLHVIVLVATGDPNRSNHLCARHQRDTATQSHES
jgi:4-aminobutyrate aminotransferase-like enzyme